MSRFEGVPAGQLPGLADGFAALVAALDGLPATKPPRRLGLADRELVDGMRALERELHAGPLDVETKIDRLRQLANAQKREPETIGQLIARKGWTQHAPATPIEEQHGDAAE